ncbi:MAG TPA: ABC transporter substrate-binding protein [Actinomycetota bacterium]|nr:ABC transporter substrate-binding protein [Actinomycetota bacterium]
MLRWGTAMLLSFLFLATCGTPRGARMSALDDAAITVASFNFSESVLLAELYGQALRSAGFRVELALDLGAREFVQPALQKGLVELVPEYAGSALEFVAGNGSASADERVTHRALVRAMASRGLTVLAASPAQDENGIVVTRETATRFDLHTISDLGPVAPQMAFGGPPECRERPLCLGGLVSLYGLRFESFVPLDEGGALTVAALQAGQVQAALLFTSDGQIDAHGFVLLKDDRHLQPAENVTPIIRTDALAKFGPRLTEVTNAVSAALTTEDLRRMNRDVAGGEASAAVAAGWLAERGITDALE